MSFFGSETENKMLQEVLTEQAKIELLGRKQVGIESKHHRSQPVPAKHIDVQIGPIEPLRDPPLHIGTDQLKQKNILVLAKSLIGSRMKFLHVMK